MMGLPYDLPPNGQVHTIQNPKREHAEDSGWLSFVESSRNDEHPWVDQGCISPRTQGTRPVSVSQQVCEWQLILQE